MWQYNKFYLFLMKKENLNKIIPLSLFFFISMNYLLLSYVFLIRKFWEFSKLMEIFQNQLWYYVLILLWLLIIYIWCLFLWKVIYKKFIQNYDISNNISFFIFIYVFWLLSFLNFCNIFIVSFFDFEFIILSILSLSSFLWFIYWFISNIFYFIPSLFINFLTLSILFWNLRELFDWTYNKLSLLSLIIFILLIVPFQYFIYYSWVMLWFF